MIILRKAFTLIEILLAMSLLALLIFAFYLIVPSLVIKARDARRKSDLHKIKNALEDYYDFAGEFPQELPVCNQALNYQEEEILSSLPCDPHSKESYYYQIKKGNQQEYRLYAKLGNNQDFSIIDVGCAGGCGPDCAYNYGVSSSNTTLTKCAYVCAPGGGKEGSCELYQNTIISNCPVTFNGDNNCANQCADPSNRCQNASGKNVPN